MIVYDNINEDGYVTVELYFSDLTEDAQKELLEAVKLTDPSVTGPADTNWNVYPITIMDYMKED